MTFKEQPRVLNDTPIQRVAANLGHKLPATGSATCPFPDHPDKNPSFQIFKPGNRWQCFGCQRSGGSIDFVMEMLSIDFVQAKKWLAEKEGASFSTAKRRRIEGQLGKSALAPAKRINMTEADSSESEPDCDVYQAYLSISPIQESGFQYLENRAISRGLSNRFMIHQAPEKSDLAKLVQSFEFDRIKKSGLLTAKSTPENVRAVFSPRSLVFPFTEGGRVVYLQCRVLGENKNVSRWWNLRSRRRRIYNVDALSSHAGKRIAICEGIMDAISATELGYDAIALMGVSSGLSEEQIKSMRDRRVEILLDWDEAGENRVKSLKERLSAYGVPANRPKQPALGIKDVNEYLVSIRLPE